MTGPDGTVISDLRFADGGNIGQADVTLEGPEPRLDQLEAAYPAGTYTFAATTVNGTELRDTAELSYELLTPPVIIGPVAGSVGVESRVLISSSTTR